MEHMKGNRARVQNPVAAVWHKHPDDSGHKIIITLTPPGGQLRLGRLTTAVGVRRLGRSVLQAVQDLSLADIAVSHQQELEQVVVALHWAPLAAHRLSHLSRPLTNNRKLLLHTSQPGQSERNQQQPHCACVFVSLWVIVLGKPTQKRCLSSHELNSSSNSNSPQKMRARRSLSDKNRTSKGESDGESILSAERLWGVKFPALLVEEEGDGMQAPGKLPLT